MAEVSNRPFDIQLSTDPPGLIYCRDNFSPVNTVFISFSFSPVNAGKNYTVTIGASRQEILTSKFLSSKFPGQTLSEGIRSCLDKQSLSA
ncbi:hypothetical protein M8J75_015385 [Diaphorina citri]|nr:hypothetical protein M8J75_015385 [Diaphorina citri]KAI5721218.1 hypothetical protein M8J77_017637 [Diaphorina citri]